MWEHGLSVHAPALPDRKRSVCSHRKAPEGASGRLPARYSLFPRDVLGGFSLLSGAPMSPYSLVSVLRIVTLTAALLAAAPFTGSSAPALPHPPTTQTLPSGLSLIVETRPARGRVAVQLWIRSG